MERNSNNPRYKLTLTPSFSIKAAAKLIDCFEKEIPTTYKSLVGTPLSPKQSTDSQRVAVELLTALLHGSERFVTCYMRNRSVADDPETRVEFAVALDVETTANQKVRNLIGDKTLVVIGKKNDSSKTRSSSTNFVIVDVYFAQRSRGQMTQTGIPALVSFKPDPAVQDAIAGLSDKIIIDINALPPRDPGTPIDIKRQRDAIDVVVSTLLSDSGTPIDIALPRTNNCYILVSFSAEFTAAMFEKPIRFTESELAAILVKLKPQDRLLVLTGDGKHYKALTKHVFRVVTNDSRSITIEAATSYNNSVTIDIVQQRLARSLPPGLNEIKTSEFEELVLLMGASYRPEKQLLAHIRNYILARGYYFDDETLANYHVCLKTRPLVILAGLSGTGKSKLSQLYAEALGHSAQVKRYLRLAVRPSWNDDRFLLGYFNTLTSEYVSEPALDFVIRAMHDPDNLYLLCLDEMNLAHVEYYFSQFLSALEEDDTSERILQLYSESIESKLQLKQHSIGRTAVISPNLLFTGTINVDETTQHISDKVIDRANTLEFFDVDLDKVPKRQPLPEVQCVSFSAWNSYRVTEPDTNFKSRVIEINNILQKSGFGLGYRVLNDNERYMANSVGLLDVNVAFDLQVKQRILPRIRGTSVIEQMLDDLQKLAHDQKLSHTESRLDEMKKRLKRDGYTSFWR